MNEEMKQKAKDYADAAYGKISAAFVKLVIAKPKTVLCIAAAPYVWFVLKYLWRAVFG